jgi:predicted Zn-dependent peptidase
MTVPLVLKDLSKLFPVVESRSSSGFPIAVLSSPNFPTISIVAAFRDGVKYEPYKLWGVSHFVEHMLLRGTKKYPTLFEISRKVEGMGGSISAYSTRDFVAFWIKALPGAEKEILEVLNQVLFNTELKDEFIKSEKAIIKQERLREYSTPGLFSSLMLESLLLLPDPISRPTVGDEVFLEEAGRETLEKYIPRVYNHNNMVVAAAGNLSPDLSSLMDSAFTDAPRGRAAKDADFEIPGEASKWKAILHPSSMGNQVHLALGWKIPVKDPMELFYWRVANTLLGAGYTSLLNQVLRERENLTYICITQFNLYGETGVFKINLALSDSKLERALSLIDDVLKDLKEMRIAPDLFRDAITRHLANVIFRMESPLEIAKLMVQTLVRERQAFSFARYVEDLERVNLPRVAELVRKHLVPENKKVFLITESKIPRQVFPDLVTIENPLDIWKIEVGR